LKYSLVSLAVVALFSLASLGANCDPVQDDLKASLGDEVAGVQEGPTHRPGQPCTVCHDGKLGDPNEFSVAGTIFQNETDRVAAEGAVVTLHSGDGSTFQLTANSAGNFYVEPSQFTAVYPMKTDVLYKGVTVKMTTNIGRDGACGQCHTDPAGPSSPGHIWIPADGVTP
jgi:hypothetical protein